MRTHPLDSAFKKGLKSNSATVPAGTWEAIQTNIPAPKSSGRAVPYWLIGFVLVAVVVLAIALWPDGNNQSMDSIPARSASTDQTFALAPNTDATKDPFENVSVTSSSTTESSADENLLKTESTHTTGTLTSERTESNHSQGNTEVSRDSKTNTPVPSTENENQQQTIAIVPVTEASTDATLNESSSDELGSSSISALIIHDEASTNQHAQIGIAPIEPLSNGIISERDIGLKVTDCYAFDKKSAGRFLLDVYTGPTFSLRSLTSKGENVDDYITARDSTESAQLSWHAGMRVGYEHSSGLTGRAGLQYTLVNEVFKQESRYSRIVLDSIFDTNGDFVRVDTTNETGTRVKQTQNRYHIVDIPLLIGYRIDNGNWDLGVQVGPVFNIAFNAKGDMINPATGLVGSFSDDSDPNYHEVFKDKIGISIYAGLYASKRIGNNLWAFVEPHFQYRLKSITLDSYPVDQKQTNIGLSVGVRLKL